MTTDHHALTHGQLAHLADNATAAEDARRLSEARRYLLKDGNLRVPCSRYGHDTETCAPVALAAAEIVADASGEPLTLDAADHVMGLVVNDHEDPFTLIRDHGTPAQRALISGLIEEGWIEEATEQGREAARAAASWTCDGNTDPEHAARVLDMLDDGDPQADGYLPARPNLSGEWAGDPTPLSLAREITGEQDPDADLIDALAEAFEDGVSEAFEDACAAELRRHAPTTPDRFTLSINLGNAAMRTPADVAAALREAADDLERRAPTWETGTLRDANGNTTGRYGTEAVSD